MIIAARRAVRPYGLARRFVPDGRFVVRSAEGPIPESLMAAWGRIWDENLDRAYVADYEIHPAEGGPPVTIYVGVR